MNANTSSADVVAAPDDPRLRLARISGVGRALPERVVPSSEIEQRVRDGGGRYRMPAGFIERVAGVRNRRHREPGQECSDFASAAGAMALEFAGIEPGEVDALLFAAASQDVAEPATACIVQDKLACSNAWAVDVKNACNSFLNGIDMALALVQTGRAQHVLVANGEVLSGTIDLRVDSPRDLSRKFAALTLGDGGGAVVVSAADETSTSRLYASTFLTDGRHWRTSVIHGGGSMHWSDPSKGFFECDSAALGEIAVEYMPKIVAAALDGVGWTTESVKAVIPHQVASDFGDFLSFACGFARDVIVQTLGDVGNTAAAGIPIALSMSVECGRIRPGDRVLLVTGAGGFSAGVTPLVW